jgi:hypothetical protein
MTVNRKELDPATQDAIKTHCAKGDELAAAKTFEEAIAEYNKIWAILPNLIERVERINRDSRRDC